MASTMTPVDRSSPLWLAWKAYTETDAYANTKRWAAHPEHVEGSLWAAFVAGFEWAATRFADEHPFNGETR